MIVGECRWLPEPESSCMGILVTSDKDIWLIGGQSNNRLGLREAAAAETVE